MTPENESIQHRRRGNRDESEWRFKVRNILNIIFLVGAIAGIAVYFFADETAGLITILAAMVFKMVECCLRFFH